MHGSHQPPSVPRRRARDVVIDAGLLLFVVAIFALAFALPNLIFD